MAKMKFEGRLKARKEEVGDSFEKALSIFIADKKRSG